MLAPVMTTDPLDIFDPTHYAAVRRPVLEAGTLPAWCYTSPAFFERERERVFLKGWNFVGRADEVAETGAYLAVETPGGPVLLVQDNAGELRAFANTCRHRGARLLTGSGTCRRLVCPYHAWTYDLDGRLVGAPGMDATAGFDTADWPLTPVRLDAWQGFLFVCFSEATPPLTEYLGDLTEQLGSYNFDDLATTRRVDYDVPCNWKLLAENAMEAYHTGTVHSASLGQQVGEQVRTAGHWDALFIAQETSIAVLPGETAPFPHIPTLEGRAREGTFFTMLHPNTQLACTQDALWWSTFRPVAADRTILHVGQCFPRATAARPNFAAEVEPYYRRWDKGIEEDNAIGAEQQAGLTSALRTPGRFSERETATHSLANWIVDQVIDDGRATRRI